jgi:hypothetical protein
LSQQRKRKSGRQSKSHEIAFAQHCCKSSVACLPTPFKYVEAL